jgi:hypothetical protein
MVIPTVHLIYVTRYHPSFICRQPPPYRRYPPIRLDRSAVMAAIFVTLGLPALNRLVEPDRQGSSLSAT